MSKYLPLILLFISAPMFAENNSSTCLSLVSDQKYNEAMSPCLSEAKQGYAVAQYVLGLMYYDDSMSTRQNYKQTLYWYTKAGNQGYANAQYKLGRMYYKGEGTPQDYQQALSWHIKAAKQGHADAQSNLGVMYDSGTGRHRITNKLYLGTPKQLSKAAHMLNTI